MTDAAPDAAMTLLVIVGALIVWFIFLRLGHRAAERMASRSHVEGETAQAERAQRVTTLWKVIRSVTALVLFGVVLLTVMSIWGIPIGPLVAVGGVVGIAVGFGAQDVIRDFIAGFLIVAEDQFSLGDVITVADVTGEVESIQLRVTVLRDTAGVVHYVPNGQIHVASNYTQGYSKAVVDVSVGYDEDIDRVTQVLAEEMELLAADPEWGPKLLDEHQILGVNMLGDFSVDVRLVFTVVPGEQWRVRREFLRRAKLRFDREGIEIPYPYVTVKKPSSVSDEDGGSAAHQVRA